jgi:hypothetical protein
MTLDAFTPRSLTENVNKIGNAQEFLLQKRVFSRRRTHPTEVIDFGVIADNLRISGYTRNGQSARPVSKVAGQLKKVEAPAIRLKKTLDADFIRTLNPGLATYMGPYATDPQSQVAEKLAIEQADLKNKIDRQVEITAAEALSTGEATLTHEDGGTVAIDYEYTGDGVSAGDGLTIQPALSGTNAWSSTGAKPLSDLQTLFDQITASSNYGGPLDVLMGVDAAKAFLNHEKVMKALDIRNLDGLGLSLVERARLRGVLGDVMIFSYAISYKNSGGTLVSGFNSKTIVVLPRDPSAFSLEFGAVCDYPDPSAQALAMIETEYFSKLVRHEDPAATDLIVQSNPIPVIKRPEAVRVLTVMP